MDELVTCGVEELAARLPAALRPLARLTFNYRWCWAPAGEGEALLRAIDPARWQRSDRNPRDLLALASPRRLEALAADPAFVRRVETAAAALDADLARPMAAGYAADHPIAYLCSEFAVHGSLPLYGGGLGVLAGDFLKAASDRALPVVGVGLMYRQGYFRQRLDADGMQREYWIDLAFDRLPATLQTGPDGLPLAVEVPVRGRTVHVQAWRIDVGRVPLYLLDTDRDDNHPVDRWITSRLYVGDRHTRLAQYAILGVGGIRMLTALGVRPALVHLNEGHGAFASVERLRVALAAGASPAEALDAVRATTVFTTHTPVPAGNEGYAPAEIEPVLGDVIAGAGFDRGAFYDLGRSVPGDGGEPFNITVLALRTSGAVNGVSHIHARVARGMWQRVYDRPAEAVPIRAVTNGVHTATWIAPPMRELLDRHLGVDWLRHVDDPGLFAAVAAIPDSELWEVRSALRRRLIEYTRMRAVRDRLGRGERPDYVDAAAGLFQDEVLTVGFARRVATYKRLYLLTAAGARALDLLADPARGIQLVIAGKAHPQDQEAKETLRSLFQTRYAEHVARRVAYLEDYDLHMAPRIVAGVDLWLNLPRPPLEACGTSGMKVALNGGLNLSIRDGWWDEACDGTNGWGLPAEDGSAAEQDVRDGGRVLDTLEREVVPAFYDRGPDGLPHRWLERVKHSLATIIPRFSAARMLADYETMYAGLLRR